MTGKAGQCNVQLLGHHLMTYYICRDVTRRRQRRVFAHNRHAHLHGHHTWPSASRWRQDSVCEATTNPYKPLCCSPVGYGPPCTAGQVVLTRVARLEFKHPSIIYDKMSTLISVRQQPARNAVCLCHCPWWRLSTPSLVGYPGISLHTQDRSQNSDDAGFL